MLASRSASCSSLFTEDQDEDACNTDSLAEADENQPGAREYKK
jgi:hypothetical protein